MIVVDQSQFVVLARGDLSESAEGLRQGDWVEVRGHLVLNTWTVGSGQKKSKPTVEAESIEVKCKSRNLTH